ncbi:MAG: hypothetical protein RL404_342 [Pseudomonadota bacterium]
MSEENQVFRGDRAPELSKGADDVEKQKQKPAAQLATAAQPNAASASSFNDVPAPAASAASFNDEPEPAAPAEAAPPAAEVAAAPVSPEPEMKFEVDPSQLWQASEAMVQRMSQLRSSAVETGNMLDEHEAEARRLEKQLKSLR